MTESRSAEDDAVDLETQAHLLEMQGSDVAAVRGMERALLLRCRISASDVATIAAAERLVIKCNTVAVKAFREDDFGLATTLLDNAMRLTESAALPLSNDHDVRTKLRGTTLNNYGCMERRRGRLQSALKLLLLALECGGQQSPATYVNVSAIQVQLGLHAEGVGNARRAIGLLERGGSSDAGLRAVALHNLAMGLEHVDPAASAPAYEAALKAAKQQFGDCSPTTSAIERNLSRFLQRSKVPRPSTLPPLVEPLRVEGAHAVHPFAVSVSEPPSTSRVDDGAPRKAAPPNVLAAKRAPKRTPSANETSGPPSPQPTARKKEDVHMRPRPPSVRNNTDPPTHRGRPAALHPLRADNGAASKAKSGLPGTKQRGVVVEGDQNDDVGRNESAAEKGKGDADDAVAPLSKSDDVVAVLAARLSVLLQAEEKFEHIFSQVVKIQTLYRCFAARRQAQRRRNARKVCERLHWLLLQSAARRIQLFFRKLVQLRRLRAAVETSQSLVYTAKNRSAVRIQRVARAWLARRVVRRKRDSRRRSSSAVRVLQCWARKVLARATTDRLRLAQSRQTRVVAMVERQRNAARCIQKHWRALASRRSIAASRREALVRRERERFTRFTTSCLTIQAWWRGLVGRGRYRRLHCAEILRRATLRRVALRKCAAVVLQGFARGIIVRRRVSGSLAEARRRRAAECEASRVRSCIRIQAWFRKVAALRAFANLVSAAQDRKLCRRVEWLCRLVQRCGRAFCARRWLGSVVSEEPGKRTGPVDLAGADRSMSDTDAACVQAPSSTPGSLHENDQQIEGWSPKGKEDQAIPKCDLDGCAPVQCQNEPAEEKHANGDESTCVANALVPEGDPAENSQIVCVVPTPPAAAAELPMEPEHKEATDNVLDKEVSRLEEPQSLGVAPPVDTVTVTQCADEVDATRQVCETTSPRCVVDVVPSRPVRFTSHENSCGATIVRVARGWRSRAHVKAVQKIVASYVDDLVRYHKRDAGMERPLSFEVLRRFEPTNQRAARMTSPEALPPAAVVDEAAAASVVQRNVRTMQARKKAAALREQRRQRWLSTAAAEDIEM